jgi:hypothetical protein
MPTQWSEIQKSRGIRLQLTWWRDRWKKKIDGKVVYFQGANSAAGYDSAMREYAQHSGAALAEEARLMPYIPFHGPATVENGEIVYSDLQLSAVKQRLDADPNFASKLSAAIGNEPATMTVATEIDKLLKFKWSQALNNTRAIRTAGELRNNLKIIEGILGSSMPMIEVNKAAVRKVYQELSSRDCGEIRKGNLFGSFQAWVTWACEQDDTDTLTIPGNLRSKEFTFTTGAESRPKANLMFKNDEISLLISTLNPQWQAIILLSLNCAFSQIDHAMLLKESVVGNRLTHRRTKTKRRPTPPLVNYKLWPETIAALNAAKSDDPVLWFTNSFGRPLLKVTVKEREGEYRESKTDTISREWQRMQDDEIVPDKPFKHLRKTGSQEIMKNGIYDAQRPLFLGQSPSHVSDTGYSADDGEPYPELDKATDWLRTKLGINKLNKPKPR